MKSVPPARRFPGFPKNTSGGLERELGANKRLRIKAPGGCLFSLFTYVGLGGFDTRSVRGSEVRRGIPLQTLRNAGASGWGTPVVLQP